MRIIGAEQFTVTRYAAATIVDHRPTSAVASTFTISASVQPLMGDDMQLIPEGFRQRKTRKAYTTTKLNTVDQDTETPEDEISINGDTYHVHRVSRQRGIIPHYKVLLVGEQE